MDKFDHFIKDKLRIKYYLRYTDDFIIIGKNPARLAALMPMIRKFLHDELALELHPKKIILRKARQGIDFLGYVVLPYYRVLRKKTKRRMLRRVGARDGKEAARLYSYLGLVSHSNGYLLEQKIKRVIFS